MKRRFAPALASYTLIELLTVMVIISILAGLTIAAFSGVMKTAARSRARTEIAGMSAAMENYNSDNGTYPTPTTIPFGTTNDYFTASSATAGGLYQLSSEALYQMLTGQTNFGDNPPAAGSGVKIYMTFKSSQLGQNGTVVYIKDPFGNSYGYFNGNGAATAVNGSNQFDLWSTGGDVSGAITGTNVWLSNWGLGN